MPRPKGLGTESRAHMFIAWICFCVVLLIGLFAGFSYVQAETVNRDAKVDLSTSKSYHRICELSEADNIEIINRRSPEAKIERYDAEQARLYVFFLQNGYKIDGHNSRFTGGYKTKLPIPDRLYIVRQPRRVTVYPFFIVDGCVARVSFEFPYLLHSAILKHMKANPT